MSRLRLSLPRRPLGPPSRRLAALLSPLLLAGSLAPAGAQTAAEPQPAPPPAGEGAPSAAAVPPPASSPAAAPPVAPLPPADPASAPPVAAEPPVPAPAAASPGADGAAGSVDQSRWGRLSGQVLDGASKKPLREVYVGVEGQDYQTATDDRGEFALPLPAGTYKIQVAFDLYEVQAFEVRVQEATTFRFDAPILLRRDKQQQVEKTVIREPSRNSTEAANRQRQDSAAVSDIVSGEEIKKAADSSASQAAARVTGATVVGDRFVYVRGLGERYANALFNGAPLPSPEPDQQAVPFDVFPASLLANLRIAKSATADIPGDFAGGSVQINTQEFPSRFQVNAALSTGANLQTAFQPALTYRGGRSDFLGIDDGTRRLPTRLPGQSDLDYYRSFPNIWSTGTGTGSPNYGLSLSLGGQREIFGRRLGYLAALSYGADFQTRNEEVRTFYLDADSQGRPLLRANVEYDNGSFGDGSQRQTWRTTSSVQWGALTSLSLQVAPLHRISLTGLFTQNSDDEARVYQGYNTGSDREVSYSRLRFVSRSLLFVQLAGNSIVQNRLGAGTVDWNATYALAARSEPDNREVAYQRGVEGGPFRLANSGTSGQRFYSQNGEHQAFAAADYTQAFTAWSQLPGRFRVGGSARGRFRDFSATRHRFGYTGVGALDASRPAEDLLGGDALGSPVEARDQTNPFDRYRGQMGIYALYALVDLPLVSRLRLNIGLRTEISQQQLISRTPDMPQTDSTIRLDNADPLPSLNLVYQLGSSMYLRASGSMTLARPEFRELAPFQFTDFFGGETVQGNPELTRTRIVNADARWEWFLGPVDLIAVSGFAKYFDRPIETVIQGGADIIRSFANATSAYTVGAELEARKEMVFAGEGPRGFSLGGNLTLLYSRVDLSQTAGSQTDPNRPMQGQSPFVVNLFAEYERSDWGTQLRVLYNVFGERIDSVGASGQPNRWEQPRHQLDLAFAQRLPKGFGLRLSAKNLLNWPVQIIQKGTVQALRGPDAPEGYVEGVTYRYRPGATVSLSLSYNH